MELFIFICNILISSIGDGLHYPMRNADEESGRLLDNNGCPAVNPSSESPPQFASEESVPMMLHTATETEVSCTGRHITLVQTSC